MRLGFLFWLFCFGLVLVGIVVATDGLPEKGVLPVFNDSLATTCIQGEVAAETTSHLSVKVATYEQCRVFYDIYSHRRSL